MHIKSLIRKQSTAAYIFLLPSMIVLLLFVLGPLSFSFFSSFFDFNIMMTKFKFIGFLNYANVLHDERFWNSLLNVTYFTLAIVPAQTVISLLLAMAVNKQSRLNVLYRTIYYLPVVCSMTIVGLAFNMILNYNIGIVPEFIRSLGFTPIDVFHDPVWAMPAIILISIYKGFGFTMVILLAALQGVPDSYYEAAQMDGANKVDMFFRITLPSIAPSLTFVVITTVIGSFQVFDQVYVITKGGPLYKTETAVQYIYERAFVTNEMGFAIANAVLLFAVILLFTLVNYQISRRSEENF